MTDHRLTTSDINFNKTACYMILRLHFLAFPLVKDWFHANWPSGSHEVTRVRARIRLHLHPHTWTRVHVHPSSLSPSLPTLLPRRRTEINNGARIYAVCARSYRAEARTDRSTKCAFWARTRAYRWNIKHKCILQRRMSNFGCPIDVHQ